MINDKIINKLKYLPHKIFYQEILSIISKAMISTEFVASERFGTFMEYESHRTANFLGYKEKRSINRNMKTEIMNVLKRFTKNIQYMVMRESKIILSEQLISKMDNFLVKYADEYVDNKIGLIKKQYFAEDKEHRTSSKDKYMNVSMSFNKLDKSNTESTENDEDYLFGNKGGQNETDLVLEMMDEQFQKGNSQSPLHYI
jgi:hypothetical protein